MLCSVVLLALVLPPLALSQDGTNDISAETACLQEPKVTLAGETILNCFNNTVMNSVNKNNTACTTFQRDLKDYVNLANACYNVSEVTAAEEAGMNLFIQFVNYSVRNGKFADFVNNTGKNCLTKVQHGISNCVKNELKKTEVSYQKNDQQRLNTLLKMTGTTVDLEPCNQALRIKVCTQKVMWPQCADDNVLYVSSLFDFMLSRCPRDLPNWMNQHDERPGEANPHYDKIKDKGVGTTHALLGVLLALAILAIFYVCFRDCRAPRGQWKALNERISMSMINRRRSLVQNEAGQTTN